MFSTSKKMLHGRRERVREHGEASYHDEHGSYSKRGI